MRCRLALTLTITLTAALAGPVSPAGAQETPSAKGTRKRLREKIAAFEVADVRIKDALDDLKREMSKPVSFKIDNVSGISNNSKVTYAAKDKTVEQILNDLCDKYDMGYVVMSKTNDRYDGWVILRKGKGKERGYEAGKEPKKADKSARVGPDVPPAGATAMAARPALFVHRP